MEIQEIKLFMKNKGITQIELAEKSQIPLTTIRYIFSGRTQTPRIDTMQAIEKALDLDNSQIPANLSPKKQKVVDLIMQLDESKADEIMNIINYVLSKDK